jgi:protein-S-isoprenylcysteine O-methyltransferase Ste14
MQERLLAKSIMVLAIVCGVGSLVLFIGFPVGVQGAVDMRWPVSGALCWDALLSLAFFLQHSGMVRRGFRTRIAGVVPPRYHRAVYSIVSGVVLAGVVVLWQSTGDRLLVLAGPFYWAARALALLAISLFIWGAFTLRNLDLFGLAPIQMYLRGTTEPVTEFVVQGPFRWVRHPWYLAAIALFWSSTDLTADRLLFNVLWTGWVCLGARLEETDLSSQFGAAYDQYRRQVPMLIPWRGPATALPASSELRKTASSNPAMASAAARMSARYSPSRRT